MEDLGTKISFDGLEGYIDGEVGTDADAGEAVGRAASVAVPVPIPLLRLSSEKLNGGRGAKVDLNPNLLQKGQVDTASVAD